MGNALANLCDRIRVPEGLFCLIGLSGGADSVALTTMLLPKIREGKIRAAAVHVNHGLRGAESDEDEGFVRGLCSAYGIDCFVYRADLSGRNDEAAAREARLAFFREALRETGADALLLAHHANDQAETFLMRLLRGSGAAGLQCMAEEQVTDGIRIIRPMLRLSREDIRDALRQDGITWREDSSNRNRAYLRNRIRMELIPLMEEIATGAVGHICGTAELIRIDNEALQMTAREIMTAEAKPDLPVTDELRNAPEAIQSRVLRMWWRASGPKLDEHELSSLQTEQLLNLLKSDKGKINLPGGYHAIRSSCFLHFTAPVPETPAPVEVNGPETHFSGYCLTETPSEGNPGDGKRTQEVPAGFKVGCQIRTMQPGDRIPVIGDWMSFLYVQNTGTAFSMFEGNRFITIILSSALIIGCLIYAIKEIKTGHKAVPLLLTCIASGGISNMIDRLSLGYVTDMISCGRFAVFNVADIAVTCGCVLTMLALLLLYREEED